MLVLKPLLISYSLWNKFWHNSSRRERNASYLKLHELGATFIHFENTDRIILTPWDCESTPGEVQLLSACRALSRYPQQQQPPAIKPRDTSTAVSLKAGDPSTSLLSPKGQAISCDISWLTVQADKLHG